jgi:hypothetical protein
MNSFTGKSQRCAGWLHCGAEHLRQNDAERVAVHCRFAVLIEDDAAFQAHQYRFWSSGFLHHKTARTRTYISKIMNVAVPSLAFTHIWAASDVQIVFKLYLSTVQLYFGYWSLPSAISVFLQVKYFLKQFPYINFSSAKIMRSCEDFFVLVLFDYFMIWLNQKSDLYKRPLSRGLC